MTLGIGGIGLSSGQKQRLALPARARLWNPMLILGLFILQDILLGYLISYEQMK
ncbi:hypothetical protein M378DRAFT_164274 [Amanita muscaria Koide BX008]|uniref:Uncharacterized protein n=1 Tax=Amanita muscaria (strain Koide BX008) TaxID=946122 RepID=A0A0C2X4H5_AMAMK|nr:hypothetical protein M378DRAFT_164274 [Amanita muscaria Koide BX008]